MSGRALVLPPSRSARSIEPSSRLGTPMLVQIETAFDLARRHPNVTRLVVGNETFFRHEHNAAELAEIVRLVKRDSPVPVATADHWRTFLDHPELVDAVDQVFAHIIPYWEWRTISSYWVL